MPNEQTKQLKLGAMVIVLFSILLAVFFICACSEFDYLFFIALPIAWYSAKFSR